MLLLEDLLDIVTLETSALIFGLIETKVDRLVLVIYQRVVLFNLISK